MIVTIDGPAGAGKSTAAKELANRLGFEFLDTGAMYRAVTWYCQHHGIDLTDSHQALQAAQRMSLRLTGATVFVDDVDVTLAIRSPEVTRESRHIAGNDLVRQHLISLQRQYAQGRNIVTEGRDQGTIAFPEAECKFYLIADPRERAVRRQKELAAKGQIVAVEELLEQQTRRDERDANREFGAMKPATDATEVDTTQLELADVVSHLESLVQSRQRELGLT